MGCALSSTKHCELSDDEKLRGCSIFSPLTTQEERELQVIESYVSGAGCESIQHHGMAQLVRQCSRFPHDLSTFADSLPTLKKSYPEEYHFDEPVDDGETVHLPPHTSVVPKAEQGNSLDRIERLFNHTLRTRMQLRFEGPPRTVTSNPEPEKKFGMWGKFFGAETKLPPPYASESMRWASDEEFGWQRVNGVHPIMLQRVRVEDWPLRKFPVDAARHVDPVLKLRGDLAEWTLESLLTAGRLFVCDYEILDGIPFPASARGCAPLVLLYVPPRLGYPLPVAIQLFQQPGDASPVFTPANCTAAVWLMCKLYVQSCDAFLMEVRSHLLQTHLIPEAIYCTLRASLPSTHPLIVILSPHFRGTMTVNWWARKDLIASGRAVPRLMIGGANGMVELLRRCMTRFNLRDVNMPQHFEMCGIATDAHTDEVLTKFYFRDDVMQHWRAIEEYASNVINLLYRHDSDVVGDSALIQWSANVSAGQAPGLWRQMPFDGSNPFPLNTRAKLTQFISTLLFTVTALHSAYQNAQWEFLGFVPNMPARLAIPPPASLDCELTMAMIAAALPNVEDSGDQVALVHSLSSPPTVPLGNFSELTGSAVASIPDVKIWALLARQLQQRLEKIACRIDERNGTLDRPYTFLHPRVVGMSVDL